MEPGLCWESLYFWDMTDQLDTNDLHRGDDEPSIRYTTPPHLHRVSRSEMRLLNQPALVLNSAPMNTDAFEGSEQVSRSDYERLDIAAFVDEGSKTVERGIIPAGTVFQLSPDYVSDDGTKIVPGSRAVIGEIAGYNDAAALDRDARLKSCGLVWREDQTTSHRWVEPSPTRHEGRIKTLPLFMVKPVPGLEIHALDGEKYVLPKDFKGDWFSVKSPTGNGLVP